MAAMETPEEKALRLKDSGNEALKICKYSEVSGQCEVFESQGCTVERDLRENRVVKQFLGGIGAEEGIYGV